MIQEECHSSTFIEEMKDIELNALFDDSHNDVPGCGHRGMSMYINMHYNDHTICALVDTGAQVSIVDEETWMKIRKGDERMEIANDEKLFGIGGKFTQVIGIVYLPISVHELSLIHI